MTHDDMAELIEVISENYDSLVIEEHEDCYDETEKKALMMARIHMREVLNVLQVFEEDIENVRR